MRILKIRTSDKDSADIVSDLTKLTPVFGKAKNPKPLNLYVDMPEFYQPSSPPFALFSYRTDKSCEELASMFDQKITHKTKSIWFPRADRGLGDFGWVDRSGLKPKCEIFIISKGRPQVKTAQCLEKMGVDFKIVIESQEESLYSRWKDRLIVGGFKNDSNCSVPVRNYVHSIANGPRYWLMDDNIEDFNVLNRNKKYVCRTPVIFRAAEDFFARFENVGMAGLNYYSFAKSTDSVPPYYLNTRIYSCTLMYKNLNGVDVQGKVWRGRYNEDTDLSLRILKAGYCTVLLNSFLAGKITTQRVRGGNTDSVYTDNDQRLRFAQSLQEQHPDVVNVVRKFNRWHHSVNYSGFKQSLIQKPYKKTDYMLELSDQGRLVDKSN